MKQFFKWLLEIVIAVVFLLAVDLLPDTISRILQAMCCIAAVSPIIDCFIL